MRKNKSLKTNFYRKISHTLQIHQQKIILTHCSAIDYIINKKSYVLIIFQTCKFRLGEIEGGGQVVAWTGNVTWSWRLKEEKNGHSWNAYEFFFLKTFSWMPLGQVSREKKVFFIRFLRLHTLPRA